MSFELNHVVYIEKVGKGKGRKIILNILYLHPLAPAWSQEREQERHDVKKQVDENEGGENESDENENDENESDENKIDENEIDENETDKNDLIAKCKRMKKKSKTLACFNALQENINRIKWNQISNANDKTANEPI